MLLLLLFLVLVEQNYAGDCNGGYHHNSNDAKQD